jgi:hypothetical protein
MNAPESPLDKKTENLERVLTPEERIARLEHTIDGVYNQLGRYISQVELQTQNNLKELEQGIGKTITLVNLSVLQNIITLRETLKMLIGKEVIDGAALDAIVIKELTTAIEAQQKAVLNEQAKLEAQAEVTESTGT